VRVLQIRVTVQRLFENFIRRKVLTEVKPLAHSRNYEIITRAPFGDPGSPYALRGGRAKGLCGGESGGLFGFGGRFVVVVLGLLGVVEVCFFCFLVCWWLCGFFFCLGGGGGGGGSRGV